jgi:hypothetical protein
LKNVINKDNAKRGENVTTRPGEPNLFMFLKLAKHLMKKGQLKAALHHIKEADEYEVDSPVKKYPKRGWQHWNFSRFRLQIWLKIK